MGLGIRSFFARFVSLTAIVLLALSGWTGVLAAGELPDLIVESCSTSNEAIPDEASDPLIDLLIVPPTGEIHDLDIRLRVTHGWVGDLVITLIHLETGTSALLVDRPGLLGLPNGCGSDDLNVVLDDDGAGGPLADQCGDSPDAPFPISPPAFSPAQPLSVFSGEQLGGHWLLSVLDARTGDSGVLVEWCLIANLGPVGIRTTISGEVNSGADVCASASDRLIVEPGAIVRVCYGVENAGGMMFDRHDAGSSAHGEMLADAVLELPPGGHYSLTRLLAVNADTTVTSEWHSRRGIAAVSATASFEILVDSDGDGTPDAEDICPGGDDSIDTDGDGVPDDCDGCPDDPQKSSPGECGCGVAEDDCGGGNENGNENENTNDDSNDNSNTNENDNSDDNANDNTDSNDNGSTADNANSNEDGGDSNTNSNANANDNSNGNTNSNSNLNDNQNGNTGHNNSNDNNNIGDDGTSGSPVGELPSIEDCLRNCGAGICGAGAQGALAAALFFLLATSRRRRLK